MDFSKDFWVWLASNLSWLELWMGSTQLVINDLLPVDVPKFDFWIHLSAEGILGGSPDIGKRAGWYPKAWNGVSPVDKYISKFCIYSAYLRFWLQTDFYSNKSEEYSIFLSLHLAIKLRSIPRKETDIKFEWLIECCPQQCRQSGV